MTCFALSTQPVTDPFSTLFLFRFVNDAMIITAKSDSVCVNVLPPEDEDRDAVECGLPEQMTHKWDPEAKKLVSSVLVHESDEKPKGM